MNFFYSCFILIGAFFFKLTWIRGKMGQGMNKNKFGGILLEKNSNPT